MLDALPSVAGNGFCRADVVGEVRAGAGGVGGGDEAVRHVVLGRRPADVGHRRGDVALRVIGHRRGDAVGVASLTPTYRAMRISALSKFITCLSIA